MDYKFKIGEPVFWKDRLWVIKNRNKCAGKPIYEIEPWRKPIHVFEKDLRPFTQTNNKINEK